MGGEKQQPSQRPDVETQRAILKQKLDQFRATGYECEVNLATTLVQEAAAEERDELVKNFETKRDNCYAAAREVAAMLAALPKPKAPKQ